MSQTQVLKSLCLRGTDLADQALYNFLGSSLEMLDVSNTKVCCQIHENWHVLYVFIVVLNRSCRWLIILLKL